MTPDIGQTQLRPSLLRRESRAAVLPSPLVLLDKRRRHGKHIYGDTYIRYKKRDESYKKETMNTWLGNEMWTTFTVGGVVKAL